MSKGDIAPDLAAPPGPQVRTWDVLCSLGFEPDPGTFSDDPGALKMEFGNFTLKAIHCLTRRFVDVVMLSGLMQTRNSIAEVECDMPQMLESRELGVAWVTWCLDRHAGGEFHPAVPTPWLADGRAWRHLLPWERQRAAAEREWAEFAVCPRCVAERVWARPAFRALLQRLAAEPDEAPVHLRFDGEVLKIRCGTSLFAIPAEGARWSDGYSVPARSLRRLPRRFKHESVLVAVFREALIVDGRRCPGVSQTGIEGEA